MSSVSLQHALVSSYLQEFSVKKVIGHDLIKYREIVGKYLFLLVLVAGCALFFNLFEAVPDLLLQWIASVLIFVIYIGCVYELLDTYLDAILITDVGLVLFQWHSPFSHTVSVIQWISIESIEHTHVGFWSSLLNLGNISIQVEDQRYLFRRVSSPALTVQHILQAKAKFSSHQLAENQPPPPPSSGDKDTYNVFIEALGEVMEEYLKKKEK